MNKQLQQEIRAFIGDDPAQAVERVRERRRSAWELLEKEAGHTVWVLGLYAIRFIDRHGVDNYSAGFADVTGISETEVYGHVVATADAETRIAAMLWAAAWIILAEVDVNGSLVGQNSSR